MGLPWSGPFRVVAMHDNHNVDVQDRLEEYPPMHVHQRRVKLYHEPVQDPEDAEPTRPAPQKILWPHPHDRNLEASDTAD